LAKIEKFVRHLENMLVLVDCVAQMTEEIYEHFCGSQVVGQGTDDQDVLMMECVEALMTKSGTRACFTAPSTAPLTPPPSWRKRLSNSSSPRLSVCVAETRLRAGQSQLLHAFLCQHPPSCPSTLVNQLQPSGCSLVMTCRSGTRDF